MREVRPPPGWKLTESTRGVTCWTGLNQWTDTFAHTDGSKTYLTTAEHRWDEFFIATHRILNFLTGPVETGSLRWVIS